MNIGLYSKNGLIAKKIAGDLYWISVAEKLPRIEDLCEKYESGRGTVQSALTLLADLGAIRIVTRGHLGTFMKEKNQELLGSIAGFSSLIGAMPLPYSKKYEGLATAIVSESEKNGRIINMAFVRGSNVRLEALKKGRYDFIVVSEFCAKNLCEKDHALFFLSNLKEKTYVSRHEVFFASKQNSQIENGMKIGIDVQSFDQRELTMAECEGRNVEFVDIRYMQISEWLKKGLIDAAILSADDVTIESEGKEFTNRKAQELSRLTTKAVYVYEKENKDVENILRQLDPIQIENIQYGVEQTQIMPRY